MPPPTPTVQGGFQPRVQSIALSSARFCCILQHVHVPATASSDADPAGFLLTTYPAADRSCIPTCRRPIPIQAAAPVGAPPATVKSEHPAPPSLRGSGPWSDPRSPSNSGIPDGGHPRCLQIAILASAPPLETVADPVGLQRVRLARQLLDGWNGALVDELVKVSLGTVEAKSKKSRTDTLCMAFASGILSRFLRGKVATLKEALGNTTREHATASGASKARITELQAVLQATQDQTTTLSDLYMGAQAQIESLKGMLDQGRAEYAALFMRSQEAEAAAYELMHKRQQYTEAAQWQKQEALAALRSEAEVYIGGLEHQLNKKTRKGASWIQWLSAFVNLRACRIHEQGRASEPRLRHVYTSSCSRDPLPQRTSVVLGSVVEASGRSVTGLTDHQLEASSPFGHSTEYLKEHNPVGHRRTSPAAHHVPKKQARDEKVWVNGESQRRRDPNGRPLPAAYGRRGCTSSTPSFDHSSIQASLPPTAGVVQAQAGVALPPPPPRRVFPTATSRSTGALPLALSPSPTPADAPPPRTASHAFRRQMSMPASLHATELMLSDELDPDEVDPFAAAPNTGAAPGSNPTSPPGVAVQQPPARTVNPPVPSRQQTMPAVPVSRHAAPVTVLTDSPSFRDPEPEEKADAPEAPKTDSTGAAAATAPAPATAGTLPRSATTLGRRKKTVRISLAAAPSTPGDESSDRLGSLPGTSEAGATLPRRRTGTLRRRVTVLQDGTPAPPPPRVINNDEDLMAAILNGMDILPPQGMEPAPGVEPVRRSTTLSRRTSGARKPAAAAQAGAAPMRRGTTLGRRGTARRGRSPTAAAEEASADGARPRPAALRALSPLALLSDDEEVSFTAPPSDPQSPAAGSPSKLEQLRAQRKVGRRRTQQTGPPLTPLSDDEGAFSFSGTETGDAGPGGLTVTVSESVTVRQHDITIEVFSPASAKESLPPASVLSEGRQDADGDEEEEEDMFFDTEEAGVAGADGGGVGGSGGEPDPDCGNVGATDDAEQEPVTEPVEDGEDDDEEGAEIAESDDEERVDGGGVGEEKDDGVENRKDQRGSGEDASEDPNRPPGGISFSDNEDDEDLFLDAEDGGAWEDVDEEATSRRASTRRFKAAAQQVLGKVHVSRSFYEVLASRAGEVISHAGNAAQVLATPASFIAGPAVGGLLSTGGAAAVAAGKAAVKKFGRKNTRTRVAQAQAALSKYTAAKLIEAATTKLAGEDSVEIKAISQGLAATLEGGYVAGTVSLVASGLAASIPVDDDTRKQLLANSYISAATDALSHLANVAPILPKSMQNVANAAGNIATAGQGLRVAGDESDGDSDLLEDEEDEGVEGVEGVAVGVADGQS
ncbi:hypothetical protein HDU96_010967 [Phlyctochytrium bullatum]|nr:hypothetical protein HDU96_010967 [Phlyctochytrium bullatum]